MRRGRGRGKGQPSDDTLFIMLHRSIPRAETRWFSMVILMRGIDEAKKARTQESCRLS